MPQEASTTTEARKYEALAMQVCLEFSPDKSEREIVIAFLKQVEAEDGGNLLIEKQALYYRGSDRAYYIEYTDKDGFFGNLFTVFSNDSSAGKYEQKIVDFLVSNQFEFSDCSEDYKGSISPY